MATGTTYTAGDSPSRREPSGGAPAGKPARWLRNLLLLALLAMVLLLGFSWSGLREQALIGSAYSAREACSCRFVSGQDLGTCKGLIAVAGLGRTGSLIWLSDDAGARTVKASVPLLASQTATFRPDRGCQLEPWTN